MSQPSLSMNPCAPLRRKVQLQSPSGVRFFYSYSTAPTTHSLEDIRHHEAVVTGLSELDAYCNLSKQVRKSGRYLHAIKSTRRLS